MSASNRSLLEKFMATYDSVGSKKKELVYDDGVFKPVLFASHWPIYEFFHLRIFVCLFALKQAICISRRGRTPQIDVCARKSKDFMRLYQSSLNKSNAQILVSI